MSETNTEVVSLLKSLSDRFDSLQKDVDTLKEKEARRSASVSSDSEVEPSNDAAPTCEQPRSGSKRHGSRRSHTSRSPASRSRSRSRSSHRAGKGEAAPTSHDARSKGKRPRDVRPVAGPTGCRTMKTPQWTIPRSSLATQRLRISQMIKWWRSRRRLRNSSRRSALGECRIVTECKSEVTTPLPKVPATRTPQLDSIMKPEASSTTKATDKQLAKVQTLLIGTPDYVAGNPPQR